MNSLFKELADHFFETAIAAIALIISIISLRLSKRTFVTDIRPVLVFVFDNKLGWSIKNIGKGPALNIIISLQKERKVWTEPVRIPPLSEGGEFLLNWVCGDTGALGTTYYDINLTLYSSKCSDDLSTVSIGSGLPVWEEYEVGRSWDQEPCR